MTTVHSVRDSIAASRAFAELLDAQVEVQAEGSKEHERLRLWAEDCRNAADHLEKALEDPEVAAWDAAWAGVEVRTEDTVTGAVVVFHDGQRHAVAAWSEHVKALLRERGVDFKRVAKAGFNLTVVNAYSWRTVDDFLAWLEGSPDAVAPGGCIRPTKLAYSMRQDIHDVEWKPPSG